GAVTSQANALDPPRLERVKDAGELRVCTWPGYYAISFRNPRNGELQGIDIDLALAFAADLGIKTKFVETSFGTFMDDLEQDRC
ncbi:transporter substrate-binding domain-containing protein, partial [Vibrio parahaemolyticus]